MQNQLSRRFVFAVVTGALAFVAGHASANHRHRSDAVVTSTGGTTVSFCTSDGLINVVHEGKAEHGSYSIGFTTLQGPQGTYHLLAGNRVVPRGCYSHWLSETAIVGNASAQSTVWYD